MVSRVVNTEQFCVVKKVVKREQFCVLIRW